MENKKINITLALVLAACVGFAQDSANTVLPDSDTLHQDKKIKVSLLGNYYGQEGDRGATNGGVGSQELYSYTREASIFLPLAHQLDLKTNIGVDYFTAASYLDIDKYKTSASSGGSGVSVDETRKYASFSMEYADKNEKFKINPLFAYSNEYDVKSKTFGLTGSYKNPKNLSVITAKASYIKDNWLLIYPGEFRNSLDGSTGASDKGTKIAPNAIPFSLGENTAKKDGKTYNTDVRNTFAIGANYAFNINNRMNSLLGLDAIEQRGLLSTPFYRVYFNDGIVDEYSKTVAVENLPDVRNKLVAYARFNYFAHPLAIIRSSLRLYTDNWGIRSMTLDFSAAIKFKPWISLMPFYRFHTQSAAKYFAGYGHHELGETYYTSDFDLANIYSNKFGASARIVPFKPLLGVKSIDFRYAKYLRSDGLSANSISAELSLELNNFLKSKSRK
jgi:hypothetical protein